MLKEIIKELEKENDADVELFFITRIKRKNKINYSVLTSNITENIGHEFKIIGTEKINKIIEKNSIRYVNYEPTLRPVDNTVQEINTAERKLFKDLIEHFNTIDLTNFDLKKSKNVWAYAIKFNKSGIILFKKYYPSQNLKKKGIMALLYKDGLFNDIDDNILTINREFDCIYFNGKIFILNKDNFEKIFSYMEEWLETIDQDLENLEKQNYIEDVNKLYEYCRTDSRKIRKLHQVLQSDFPVDLNKNLVQRISKDFDLELEFNENDELIIKGKDIWKILRILDDDHLNSIYSKTQYIVHSKEKK